MRHQWHHLAQPVGHQTNQGKESQQGRSGSGNGLLRPLALGLHPQVTPTFFKSHFHVPAQYKPLYNLVWGQLQAGAEECL